MQMATKYDVKERARFLHHWKARGYTFQPGEFPPMSCTIPPKPRWQVRYDKPISLGLSVILLSILWVLLK